VTVEEGGAVSFQSLTIGDEDQGEGALSVAGAGSQVDALDVTLGKEEGSYGAVTVTDAATFTAADDVTIGESGAGDFMVNGGATASFQSLTLGESETGEAVWTSAAPARRHPLAAI